MNLGTAGHKVDLSNVSNSVHEFLNTSEIHVLAHGHVNTLLHVSTERFLHATHLPLMRLCKFNFPTTVSFLLRKLFTFGLSCHFSMC